MAQVKLYSVDQAERALPLVRRIAQDIVNGFVRRDEVVAARNKLPTALESGSEIERAAHKLDREIELQSVELQRFARELDLLGVVLKDWRTGLIDFYSHYDGRIVHLCWKLDEGDKLAWWHDLKAGFSGRQPITAENRAKFLNARSLKA